ncbi:hypothetical protein [Tautonia rosea]|uniref:hypothetical protein n=1 Tax=Tautonia rosea TaxID=2728037 RepID=UPI001C721F90|nr:hypothetical protein [Tautonia rosea]
MTFATFGSPADSATVIRFDAPVFDPWPTSGSRVEGWLSSREITMLGSVLFMKRLLGPRVLKALGKEEVTALTFPPCMGISSELASHGKQ